MTSTIPPTMRAIVQPDPHSTDLILTTVPTPTPEPNTTEHLIKVQAISPCNGELLWPPHFPPSQTRTFIPCPDFAGTVVSAPDDSPFQPESEVYTRANYLRNGAGSEYTLATTDELALCPKGLSWAERAAIPLSSLTAWQALFVHCEIGGIDSGNWKKKKVLVTGASGGVGAWVVQLAKLVGAKVIGTCGGDNVGFVKGLGCEEVLDYRATDMKTWAEGLEERVDVVIDCVGKKSLADAWWAVKDGGLMLSIFQSPNTARPDECEVKDVKDIFFIMEPNGEHLAAITKLVEEGKCRGFVDSVYPLEKFEEAFEKVGTGHAKGKVVVELSTR
ncbi:NADP-dependent oxidoreductase [Aspergillus stella-maris]|uniref:NADP-dependent oxidoreductase n=1 Tax=Aspergillus stella-maris TaxID=1810926 RepID=UPI003CCD581A